jgi:alpha-beta hydrolase superfamily lysophospholipase
MKFLPSWIRRTLRYLIVVAIAVPVTIVLVFAMQARMSLPDLKAWHRIELRELSADDPPASFAEYRALEERLFADIRARIIENPADADTLAVGRYTPGTRAAQLAFDTPYNRSVELMPPGEPVGAAVLVHGLTDSPYSMRPLGEILRSQGYYVILMRMPGHGTVPSGLDRIRWQDWYAALELTARHASAIVGGDKPLVLGGFSTGAALSALYAVRSLDDPGLPRPDRLYLMSAAIGISPFAVMTNIVSKLSFLPMFEKSRWLDVLPEYDPYKYNSFPVNAGNQIYKLTHALNGEILDAAERGRLGDMPRVVIFQSIVDSTVTSAEVVRGMLDLLPEAGHELVVFDVNRSEVMQGLLAQGPLQDLEALRNATGRPFAITLIGSALVGDASGGESAATDPKALASYRREAGGTDVTVRPLPYTWPQGIFSLGHTALPVPADDPVYGISPPEGTRFNLGAVALRGESGALVISLGTFARLRSNPFFDVIREKVIETLPR